MVHIRMTEELRDALQGIAEANKRSMNAEIVARLEGSFSGLDRSTLREAASDAMREAVKELFQETLRQAGGVDGFIEKDKKLRSELRDWLNGIDDPE